ncbi:hypothetical protein [Cellulosilyticum sp. I15G10I2]|uniref:hypothetical protein n=1 Tax=Cellulosilyticum sp. I15G10I2 TaxID=1892843 RepID=UPI00085C1A9D|nr:hypothetical protein [Cellulosilyticum sp. I15G10I2]
MINYEMICTKILQDNGPLLGSELQEYLISKTGVTENNARQVIYRLKNNNSLLTTEPVKFTRNQVIYFLPKQNIRNKLREVIPDHAQTIHRVYQALIEQDGFLHWSEFVKISAGVFNSEQVKDNKHKTVEKIFNDMLRLKLVKPIRKFNHDSFVIAHEGWVPLINTNEIKLEERLRDLAFGKQFTGELLRWIERMNIAGWNSTHVAKEDDDEKGINGYYWDAYGFSYLWGLYESKNDSIFSPTEEKTGSLIVIESVLYREMRMYDVSGFIARISVLYGKLKTKNNFRIIPICFVQSIDEDALKAVRKRGIMIVSVTEVFGTKIAEALKMVRILDPRNVDAEALAGILAAADQSGHDGKFGSLKGYVFNFLIASIFSNQGYSSVKIGVKYDSNGDRCECDIVISVDDDYLIVCETKGYNEGTLIELGDTDKEADTVKKFFEKTCTIVESETGKKVLPLFITSGDFTEDALNYMSEISKRKKIIRLLQEKNFPKSIYLNRGMLMDFFSNKQIYTEHKKVLKEFFRKHKSPNQS